MRTMASIVFPRARSVPGSAIHALGSGLHALASALTPVRSVLDALCSESGSLRSTLPSFGNALEPVDGAKNALLKGVGHAL